MDEEMKNDITSEENWEEFDTFIVETKDGEVELAVVEEFEFEGKKYVLGAKVEGDVVSDDGFYIYRSVVEGNQELIERLKSEEEYNRVSEAYFKMQEEEGL